MTEDKATNIRKIFQMTGLSESEAQQLVNKIRMQQHKPIDPNLPDDIRAAIIGMRNWGCEYDKHDERFMYFYVPKYSELYIDQDKLGNAQFVIRTLTGLGLKVRKDK